MNRIAFTLAAVAAVAAPACAADLESALLDRAKGLVAFAKAEKYQTVGVLKFHASTDGEHWTDNLGTINTLIARRLEVALVLANDPRNPVGVIDDATATAAGVRGANHFTAAGRKALLAADYKPAWGDPKARVKPSAFFTGLVTESKDLKTLTVSFFYFDAKKNDLRQVPGVADAVVVNRAAALVELGESFTVRGAFDGGKVEAKKAEPKKEEAKKVEPKKVEAKKDAPPADLPKGEDQAAIKKAVEVRDQQGAKHPAEDPSAPVRLTVLYDGRPVKVEVKEGKAFVPEPAAGQTVQFVLTKDATAKRYGVVLKVNGENTLDKQRLPDVRCRMWVLTTPNEVAGVGGYVLGTDRVEKFRVLSAPESKAREVNYGADVGTLTLTVFPEGAAAVPDLAENAAEKTAVAKAELPAEPSKSIDALKAKLLDDANRGLIVEGAAEPGNVRTVTFTPAAAPVMTLTVVYRK